MTADLAAVLEEIALGEADLGEASAAIAKTVSRLNDDLAAKLYESLRSFVWKALDARRRDAELLHWLDVIGRVSSSLADVNRELATKLEAFAELLHTSIARASAPSEGLFERKHVRNVVRELLLEGGTVRKRNLLAATGLREANLARIMAPLRDAGWVQRSMDGKEAMYRITKAGREAAPAELRTLEARSAERLRDIAQNYLVAAAVTRTGPGHRWPTAGKVARKLGHSKREDILPPGLQFTDLVRVDNFIQLGNSSRERQWTSDPADSYFFYSPQLSSPSELPIPKENR